ncbi:prepilin peptidase [Nocardia uniformis]|uniref:Prepilin peptidase n=1 Tax=Nocardia uniformis TaxID=53432 RepID=A0A849BZ63_9NOCA|nr:A24 family peptidase [Nocardia uniformis]NNH71594.1 prepilin peptidase [Nocardia uniformis]
MEPLPLLVLTAWCAVLSGIDLRHRRLPNALTLPGAVVVLAYGFGSGRLALAAVGAGLLAVPYLLVHLAAPAALGAGDVKLAIGLGAATALGGAHAWVWAAVAAPVLTALAGAVAILAQTLRPRDSPHATARPGTIAHGPAMCLASVLALAPTACWPGH